MRRLRDLRRRLWAGRLKWAATASLLGALGIAVWLYAPSPTVAEKAAARTVSNPAVTSSTGATLGPSPRAEPVPARMSVEQPRPVGQRLAIASLGVDVGVFGGDPAVALRRGLYHHAGTADPGERGNVVLAGHRNRRVFSLLHMVKIGDAVTVRWHGTTYEYRVAKMLTVNPDDTWILAQTGPERLTLYTCLPRSMGNKRTVVVALPVKP